MDSPRRTTISGKKALLLLAGMIVVLGGGLYVVLVKLQIGGNDAIRLRSAPATGAAPSQ